MTLNYASIVVWRGSMDDTEPNNTEPTEATLMLLKH